MASYAEKVRDILAMTPSAGATSADDDTVITFNLQAVNHETSQTISSMRQDLEATVVRRYQAEQVLKRMQYQDVISPLGNYTMSQKVEAEMRLDQLSRTAKLAREDEQYLQDLIACLTMRSSYMAECQTAPGNDPSLAANADNPRLTAIDQRLKGLLVRK